MSSASCRQETQPKIGRAGKSAPALFVAVKIPEPIGEALRSVQPGRSSTVRPVPPDRFHLTLRYIGREPPETLLERLAEVDGRSLELRIAGTGRFGSPGRGVVLWVGVEASPELSRLQAGVESAVVSAGCPAADRTFNPHVTLARCKPGTTAAVYRDHEARTIDVRFTAREFGLYSSHPARHGSPVYRLERAYPLSG